jgi:hypothetical protein
VLPSSALNQWYSSTRLRGVISLETTIFLFISVVLVKILSVADSTFE